ncbi:MAG: hypothetical protein ACTSU5_08290 [Promethearchaeota archaeon]
MVFFTSFLSLTVPATAFESRVDVRANDNKYYLVELNATELFWLNLSSVKGGDFNVYVSTTRPTQSGIMDNLVARDDSPAADAHIYYVANQTRIYYIQIVLNSDDPDTFILNASKELTQYFIPFLPGYPPLLVFSAVALPVAVLAIRARKRE